MYTHPASEGDKRMSLHIARLAVSDMTCTRTILLTVCDMDVCTHARCMSDWQYRGDPYPTPSHTTNAIRVQHTTDASAVLTACTHERNQLCTGICLWTFAPCTQVIHVHVHRPKTIQKASGRRYTEASRLDRFYTSDCTSDLKTGVLVGI